jgi:nitroreductase
VGEHDAGVAVPIPAGQADYLIATAARAPSVHNTQPWRFRVGEYSIELYSDPGRKLRVDPLGREMLISCGAALFGLRLAVRSLGYQPVVSLLPDPGRLRLLAEVTLRAAAPASALERQLLDAIPRRHTHRGPFAAGPLPARLMPALQHDALAEGAMLVPVDRTVDYQRLAEVLSVVSRRQDADPLAQADARQWTRESGSAARDGVPARAFPAGTSQPRGRLAQRDFDLGRGVGFEPWSEPGLEPGFEPSGSPAARTFVLVTRGDGRAEWLHAGQALQRLLLHAASKWVFACIYTQPLEAAAIRALIRDRLALPGSAQILMQLGRSHITHPTARRPVAEVIDR